MKYCYICKELIKSKLLYLRHMQLHITKSPKKTLKSPENSVVVKKSPPIEKPLPVRRTTRSSISASAPSTSQAPKNDKNNKSLDKKKVNKSSPSNSNKLSLRKSGRQKKL